MMERNEGRWWYDKGYSLGVTETQRDAAIPRLIGAWSLFAITFADWRIAAPFLALYTWWTLMDYRNRSDEAKHKRDVYDPGDPWEWE